MSETITGQGTLNIAGTQVEVSVTVPITPVKAKQMLPIFQQLANTIVGIGEKKSMEAGKPIACGPSCGACCRQLVPISVSEAYQLSDLVEALPEPRRATVKQRFETAIEKTRQAEIQDGLLEAKNMTPEQRVELALEYFSLGIACPFLEEESCSIHPDRPVVCREYLVTSDPKYCADPLTKKIEGVTIPAAVSKILYEIGGQDETLWIPMIWALDWAENHEDKTQARTGQEWMGEIFKRIS